MTTIKIKSGLEANRNSIIPVEGELIYTTDEKHVYVGDGATSGGIDTESSAAEILASLLTVDGSGSTLDGDTIGSLDGSQLLRNDQDGILTGDLTLDDKTLDAINTVANANGVVDVFVYDTSKDSDGGQWRERCSHLSWYNEALNTATR